MEDFEKIIREKGLPDVGQMVRSKKYGILWRVIEKKEVWQNIEPDPKTGESRMTPAIYLSYWRVQANVMPGVGRMLGFLYTIHDNTFELNWEVVESGSAPEMVWGTKVPG
jgi:hypothetical protein